MRSNLRHFTDIINFRGTRAIAPLHVEYLIRWVAKHGTVFIPSPVVGLLWSPVGVCKYFSRGNPHPCSFMDDVGGSEVEGANACKDRNQTSHSTKDTCINRFCDWQSLFLALSFTYFNQNYSTHGIVKRYTKEYTTKIYLGNENAGFDIVINLLTHITLIIMAPFLCYIQIFSRYFLLYYQTFFSIRWARIHVQNLC